MAVKACLTGSPHRVEVMTRPKSRPAVRCVTCRKVFLRRTQKAHEDAGLMFFHREPERCAVCGKGFGGWEPLSDGKGGYYHKKCVPQPDVGAMRRDLAKFFGEPG